MVLGSCCARLASNPSGIAIVARISLLMILSFQSGVAGSTSIFLLARSAPTTCGESAPPSSITRGISSFAFDSRVCASPIKPTDMSGKSSRGTNKVEINVRRSRSESVNSLRYTVPIFCKGMSGRLLGFVVRRDHLHKNLLQVLLLVFLAQPGQRTLRQKLARLDNPDDVAEFFHLAHHVR